MQAVVGWVGSELLILMQETVLEKDGGVDEETVL